MGIKKGEGLRLLFLHRVQQLGKMRDRLFDRRHTDSKLSGVAIVQLQDIADVISGEHVTLLPGDGDDVVVHVT